MKTIELMALEKEFKKVRFNPIYFIENYYNVVNADNPAILSDNEKQSLYNEYKGIPLLDEGNWSSYFDRRKKLQEEEGYKDWEIDDILHDR